MAERKPAKRHRVRDYPPVQVADTDYAQVEPTSDARLAIFVDHIATSTSRTVPMPTVLISFDSVAHANTFGHQYFSHGATTDDDRHFKRGRSLVDNTLQATMVKTHLGDASPTTTQLEDIPSLVRAFGVEFHVYFVLLVGIVSTIQLNNIIVNVAAYTDDYDLELLYTHNLEPKHYKELRGQLGLNNPISVKLLKITHTIRAEARFVQEILILSGNHHIFASFLHRFVDTKDAFTHLRGPLVTYVFGYNTHNDTWVFLANKENDLRAFIRNSGISFPPTVTLEL